MEGKSGRGVLGIESPDPTLSYLGGLGLALSAGTALLIDLEGGIHTSRTLADFAESGPGLIEMSPGRLGVALLSGGGASDELAAGLIAELARAWPAVVVRCRRGQHLGPTVPLRPLLPGLLASQYSGPTVWQPTRARRPPPGPGPVLPSLSPRLVRMLLAGRSIRRTAWVRAWGRVWEMPWV